MNKGIASPGMLAAVVQAFYAARPWRDVDDHVFGLRCGDQLVFVGLMGSGGREHGVLLVKGWDGYAALSGMLSGDLDDQTAIQQVDLLSLSTEATDELPLPIRQYATRQRLPVIPALGKAIVIS